MLTGFRFEFGLVSDSAARAFQKQVRAFTAREFGLGAEVTCHLNFLLIIYRQQAGATDIGAVAVGLVEKIRYDGASADGSRCEARALHPQSC